MKRCNLRLFIIALLFFISGYVSEGRACQSGGDTFAVEHDASGNLVAVWQAKSTTNGFGEIYGSTMPAGGSWTSAVMFSVENVQCEKPLVAVAANGNAVSVWLANDDHGSFLEASILPYGGSWTVPVAVSDYNVEEVMNNSYGIIMDDSGNMTAFWTGYMIDGSSPPSQQVFRSASGFFGAAWTSPVTLSPPPD